MLQTPDPSAVRRLKFVGYCAECALPRVATESRCSRCGCRPVTDINPKPPLPAERKGYSSYAVFGDSSR